MLKFILRLFVLFLITAAGLFWAAEIPIGALVQRIAADLKEMHERRRAAIRGCPVTAD